MAKQSSFAFKNTAEISAATVKPVDIRPVTCYAKTADEPDVVVLSNKTTPLDQGELITYRCQPVDKVSTSQTLQNPSPVRNGVQYVVKAEEILRTIDDQTGFIIDEPVVAYLTIRHQASGNITPDLVSQVVTRVIGAAMREDGTWRFDDLMRSALAPVVD